MANRITIYVNKEGKISHIDSEVKAKEDGQTVAAKLEELKFSKKKSNSN